jgi:hypothetical protein
VSVMLWTLILVLCLLKCSSAACATFPKSFSFPLMSVNLS